MHNDANKLADVRQVAMKKKRLTDAELQEIKNKVKTIIKKINKLLLLSKLKVNQKMKNFISL